MLALGTALRLLQRLHGVAGVTHRLPQLPQPLGQLDHTVVQHVQTNVHLVQACVQAGQASHCGRTGSMLDGDLGREIGGPEALGGGDRDLRPPSWWGWGTSGVLEGLWPWAFGRQG